VEDAIEFNFHLADTEKGLIVQEDERPGSDEEEAALIAQFRRLFAPILDDSLNLYYQLNDLDDTEHVRIHQTVAQMNDLTSSEEETMVTQVNSPSPPPVGVELLLPISSDSSTASSSLYAIHTPSPAHPSFKGQGDKWDQKAKVRSITASFSLNGVGLVPEESPDLYQENEELKVMAQRHYDLGISIIWQSSTGTSPETGPPNRVHEDCAHADEQQASEAKARRIFHHNFNLVSSAI